MSDDGRLYCTRVPLSVFDDIDEDQKQKTARTSRQQRAEYYAQKKRERDAKFAEYERHWQEFKRYFRSKGINI